MSSANAVRKYEASASCRSATYHADAELPLPLVCAVMEIVPASLLQMVPLTVPDELLLEVVVELQRIGGTPSSWYRSNRAFADELRKQFLLWRSLPVQTIEHYRAQTEAVLAGAESAS